MEDKTEGQKKPKTPTRTKEGRELVLLVVGNYFTHSPFNVACMQIMRPNIIKKSRTNISRQCNFPRNKMVSLIKLLYLWIVAMVLSFTSAHLLVD